MTGREWVAESVTIPLPIELPVCEICEFAGPCNCQTLVDAEHQQARELHEVAGVEGPCGCWHLVVIHEGHCCFRDDPAPLEEISLWQPPMCGHWPDFVSRPVTS